MVLSQRSKRVAVLFTFCQPHQKKPICPRVGEHHSSAFNTGGTRGGVIETSTSGCLVLRLYSSVFVLASFPDSTAKLCLYYVRKS